MEKRKFAVFDIDGTLIRWQLYHAIADAVVRLGFVGSNEFEHVKNARMRWKQRQHEQSFREYEHELVHAYERLLAGMTATQFDQAADDVFSEYKDQVYTFTRDLIKDLKQKGYALFAISGSQAEIVKKIADYYGFDDCVGTVFERKDGKFTGSKTAFIGRKHEILLELIEKHEVAKQGSVGVGDSLGDVAMLEVVETPIAFNPEKPLFEAAKERHWPVVIERKNVIIRLEPNNGTYILAEADA